MDENLIRRRENCGAVHARQGQVSDSDLQSGEVSLKMPGGKKKKSGDKWGGGQISFGADAGFSLSLGDLFGKSGQAGQREQEPTPGEKEAKAEKKAKRGKDAKEAKNETAGIDGFLASATQATLHRESAGRGGRTVVVLSIKPEPDHKIAEALAKAMRKGLGCGAHAEGAQVILQGDIQERAAVWLTKRGVRRAVMGN
jgi:translation initiation factor 1 (eIF-1/SUI1)